MSVRALSDFQVVGLCWVGSEGFTLIKVASMILCVCVLGVADLIELNLGWGFKGLVGGGLAV